MATARPRNVDDIGSHDDQGRSVKVRCDPIECCGQEHEYPEIVPCPKCGSVENVVVWEAWGHPNGELYCQECVGFFSNEPAEDYWTWHMKDGQAVINAWQRSTV
jgi:hypothetical protein